MYIMNHKNENNFSFLNMNKIFPFFIIFGLNNANGLPI